MAILWFSSSVILCLLSSTVVIHDAGVDVGVPGAVAVAEAGPMIHAADERARAA
jgi:hypothetical protein